MSASVTSTGRITQILGPVVDVEFPPGGLPEVYSALKITNPAISTDADNLVVEVAAHLGENTVRCIAMAPARPSRCPWAPARSAAS
jgi:F-type H+/Na+-transporting ATPase subunit beta